jgi:Gene product 88
VSAIITHLELQNETSPMELRHAECVSDLDTEREGLSDHEHSHMGVPAAETCPLPVEALAQSHHGLLQLVWARQAVEDMLAGRTFRVQNGTIDGKDPRSIYIVVEGGIGGGPAWNPTTNPGLSNFSLLSWTSKMNCPSWSIPAGAPQIGGTCPGAVGGQSIVPLEALRAGQRNVQRVIGGAVRVDAAICEQCYATGGQYSTSNVQYSQVLRHLWARQAIDQINPATGRTMFVDTMSAAITTADFKLNGGSPSAEDPEKLKLPPERTGRRFFRIHDSGDFFSAAYLAQWKIVADAFPDITFWAPSRIWATSWGVEAVNDINRHPTNFVIRPSAYHIGQAPPIDLGPGWAGGTTVIPKAENEGMTPEREAMVREAESRLGLAKPDVRKPGGPDPRYTWDCRAYAQKKGNHTCRNAISPTGEQGCRACWIFPNEIVNYTLH